MKKRDQHDAELPARKPLAGEVCSSPDAADQTSGSVSVIQSERTHDTSVALPAFRANKPGPPLFVKHKNKLTALIGTALLLLGALGGTLWWLKSGAIPPNVTLYQVGSAHNVTLSIGGGGLVYPRQQINISYPSAERVISVLVKAGDHVAPNQSLLQIDPSQLNVEIKQASDDLNAAQAYLNSISFSGTSVNIAQAQQAVELARNRFNALQSQASSPLLHGGNLVSPMNGIITTVNVNPGEVFPANTTIITIMDETSVMVRVKVPLANLGQVHIGQNAVVSPSALTSVNIPGVVSNIIPQADPQTDTFEVWVSIPNQGSQLLPGMSAFVRIETPAQALALPRLAVLSPEGDAAVFVVHNQVAHWQNIKVVGRDLNTIYVGDGLNLGDQIVLVGLDGLHDGQRVHVAQTEKPKP